MTTAVVQQQRSPKPEELNRVLITSSPRLGEGRYSHHVVQVLLNHYPVVIYVMVASFSRISWSMSYEFYAHGYII